MKTTAQRRWPLYGSTARAVELLIGVLALLAGGAGCKGNLIGTKQEVKIGQQAARQVEQEYVVDTTSEDAVRVQRIGERLLPHTDQRPGVPYVFYVIDRDRRTGKSDIN